MYLGGSRKTSTILKFDFIGKNGFFIGSNKRLIDFTVENGRFKSKTGNSIDFIGKGGISFNDFIDNTGSFIDYIGKNGNLIGYYYYDPLFGKYDSFINFMSKISSFIVFIGIKCDFEVNFIAKNGRIFKFKLKRKNNSSIDDIVIGDNEIGIYKNPKTWYTITNNTSERQRIESISNITSIRVNSDCMEREYDSHCDNIILKFDPNTLSWTHVHVGEMSHARINHGISLVNAEDVKQFCVSLHTREEKNSNKSNRPDLRF